jgi:hypothetical protein
MSHRVERAVRRTARSAVSGGTVRGVVAVMVAVWLGMLATAPVAAHGESFFQLGAERIEPGGQVEVRADLGAGDRFEVTLISKADGSRRTLGTFPATEEGHLQTWLTIPVDVPAGDYLVELAYDLTVLRAPLTVAGSPLPGGDEGQLPGQDDGFGPPASGSGAPGGPIAAQPSPGPAAPEDGEGVRGRRDGIDGPVSVGIALLAAVALLGVLRLSGWRRRPTN